MDLQTIINILVIALFGTAIANLAFAAVNRFVVGKQDPKNNPYYKRATVVRLFDWVFFSYFIILTAFATYFYEYGYLLDVTTAIELQDHVLIAYTDRIAHVEYLTLISVGVAAISVITAIAYFKSRSVFARKQIPTDIVEKEFIEAEFKNESLITIAKNLHLSDHAIQRLSHAQ